MTKKFDVIGMGNAIVDVIAPVEDSFLAENGIEKGIMQLIDTERAAELYSKMGPATEKSGGSAANTVAGLASLGVSTAYFGKVKDDQLGNIFAHDLAAIGATFDVPRSPKDHPDETARSMILVSPDGERSMNTYLGVSATFGEADVDPVQMAQTNWLYMEGYLYDKPESQKAFDTAAKLVREAGGKTSISLSDPFCVERHREAFLQLIRSNIDLLFCNEHELMSLYQTDDIGIATTMGSADVEMLACTQGEKGASIFYKGQEVHVPADEVNVVDATGAGDLFATGFLYGLTRNHDLRVCASMGCVAAGAVISDYGARPSVDLKKLFIGRNLD